MTEAGKSGLGMVSEDGAHISNVVYDHVVMSDTQSPIMEKIGTRLRCGGSPTIGSISDIHYDDVTGTSAGAFSPTLWGQPGHPVSDITFTGVHLTLPGGIGPMDPNTVPTDNGDYNPSSLGTRPAYGFYLHNVAGITFSGASLRLAADDARPAFIANSGRDVTLDDVTVQRGSDSPFDVGFQYVTGYCLVGTRARISTPGSTGCSAGLDNFSLTASPASGTLAAGSSATFALRTAVTSGHPGPVTLTATSPQAGLTVSVSPATVQPGGKADPAGGPASARPGGTATLRVSAAAGARDGTYQIPVTATDATATQYATVTVTVTGGVTLAITGLSVADGTHWSVQPSLQPGDVMYGDRTITVVSVPAELTGAAWIQTANDSKSSTEDPLATFTINAPATVAVAVDTRLGRLAWMDSSWTDSGLQLTDSESTPRTFEVFTRTFPAGTVTLGPQADETNSSSMYTVGVF